MAFEVLSDEKKKKLYDQGGLDALKEGVKKMSFTLLYVFANYYY